MGFDFTNAPERDLYQGFLTEAINIYGIDIEYWRTDRNTEKDKLYTEDIWPVIRKKFNLRAMTDDGKLIKEIYNFGKFGFQSPDALDLYISRQQFIDAYGEDATPRAGDFIAIKYMGEDITKETIKGRVFYISTVEMEDHIFLQKKHTYRLHLVAADSEGMSISPEISGATDPADQLDDMDFPNYNPELNDDSATNTPEITGVLHNKPNDPSPWGDW